MQQTPPSPRSSAQHSRCPSSADAHASRRAGSGARRALLAAPEPLVARLTTVDAQVHRDAPFEVARQKFAFYGRGNAHISHLGASEGQCGLQRASRDAVALQNTLTLQENGALAARLDEIRYLLGGVLEPTRADTGADDAIQVRRLAAQTRSVLELARLLQDPKLLTAVNLSRQRRALQAQIREALQLLQHSTQSGKADMPCYMRSHRLALALLAYFLADSPDAEEFFDDKTLDAMVLALKAELVHESGQEQDEAAQAKPARETELLGAEAESSPMKKRCLKRKRTSPLRTDPRTSSDAADDHKTATGGDDALKAETSGEEMQADESAFQAQVTQLLRGHDAFFADGKLEICTIDVVCQALYRLLQMDNASAGNLSAEASVGLGERHQRRDANVRDTANATFSLVRARKARLVRNGGVNTLLYALANLFSHIDGAVSATRAELAASECVWPLRQARTLLQVLDQASFLSTDVQQYMSKKKAALTLLLRIVRLLSRLGWGSLAISRWESSPGVMISSMEVLSATMRVLINLTHHNDEAAKHVHDLRGMELLARAFGGLWRFVEEASSPVAGSACLMPIMAKDKWAFDAFLLFLSALANCVEFSPENRLALVQTSLSPTVASSVCDLLTRFFLSKVQSFVQLLDRTEGMNADTAAMDEDDESWNPEDVILSGCTSLLLGYLMEGSSANSTAILSKLPDRSPRLLLRALSVFAAFHSQIGALTSELAQSVLQVEAVLKSLSRPPANALLADVEMSDVPGTRKVTSERESSRDVAMDAAVEVDVVDIDIAVDQTSSMSLDEPSMTDASFQSQQTVELKSRPLRNVCSNVDESDLESESETQSETQSKTNATLALEKKVTSSEEGLPVGLSSPKARRMPRSPRTPKTPRTSKKTPRTPSTPRTPVRASPSSQRGPCETGTSGKSPRQTSSLLHSAKRDLHGRQATPTSALRGDSLTSPTVLRLKKRTRQLMYELDAAFAEAIPVRSMSSCGSDNPSTVAALSSTKRSSTVTTTNNPSDRDDDVDNLDFSRDAVPERCGRLGSGKAISPQRVALGLSPYKRRLKTTHWTGKSPLQTPTRRERSPSVRQTPMSESPSLRKVKSAPTRPAACASAIFDFDE